MQPSVSFDRGSAYFIYEGLESRREHRRKLYIFMLAANAIH